MESLCLRHPYKSNIKVGDRKRESLGVTTDTGCSHSWDTAAAVWGLHCAHRGLSSAMLERLPLL